MRSRLADRDDGDRQFFKVLTAVQENGLEAVGAPCAEALGSDACSADVVLNILAWQLDEVGQQFSVNFARTMPESTGSAVRSFGSTAFETPSSRWPSVNSCRLSRALTKRSVNRARTSDMTEGYAANQTILQLREHAHGVADMIGKFMDAATP